MPFESRRTLMNGTNKRAVISSIIGDTIYNRSGENLGQIVDIMFDSSNGRIEFVVITFGGFLGYNKQYAKVPFKDLSVDRQSLRAITITNIKGSLNAYSKFRKNQWRESTSMETSSRDSDYFDFMNGDGA